MLNFAQLLRQTSTDIAQNKLYLDVYGISTEKTFDITVENST